MEGYRKIFKRKNINVHDMPGTIHGIVWFFVRNRFFWFILYFSSSLFFLVDTMAVHHIFSLIVEIFETNIADRGKALPELLSLSYIWAATYIIVEIGYRICDFARNQLIPNIEGDIRLAVFERIQLYPPSFFSKQLEGSIENRVSELVDGISDVIEAVANRIFPSVCLFLGSVVICFMKNTTVGIIFLCWGIFHILVCLLSAKKASRYSAQTYDKQNYISGVLIDSFSNSYIKYLFGMQKAELNYLSELQYEERNTNKRFYDYTMKIKAVLAFLVLVFQITFLVVMIKLWIQNKIDTKDVVFLFSIQGQLILSLWSLVQDLQQLYGNMGQILQSMTVILDCKPVVEKKSTYPFKFVEGYIEVKNVTVPGRLDSVSTIIKPGQITFIVGKSGSGKSSFLNILNKSVEPESGHVLIDNVDFKLLDHSQIRTFMSYVSQDTMLFNRSIRDNITLYRNVTEEEISAAIHSANLTEDIKKLPGGLNYSVGSKGSNLSGGQRQRVTIARALLKKKTKILILDEFSSSLDPFNEKEIMEQVLSIAKKENITLLVVTHSLLLTCKADNIIVMEDQKIVEEGTHDNLIALKKKYYELFQTQMENLNKDQVK